MIDRILRGLIVQILIMKGRSKQSFAKKRPMAPRLYFRYANRRLWLTWRYRPSNDREIWTRSIGIKGVGL